MMEPELLLLSSTGTKNSRKVQYARVQVPP